ncbi:MAG: hypothetical protein GAK40_01408 [Burkholderia plantarii]|nr:MAG: hypothetical protein GAK40_01408 [Burkholderia plantarii]
MQTWVLQNAADRFNRGATRSCPVREPGVAIAIEPAAARRCEAGRAGIRMQNDNEVGLGIDVTIHSHCRRIRLARNAAGSMIWRLRPSAEHAGTRVALMSGHEAVGRRHGNTMTGQATHGLGMWGDWDIQQMMFLNDRPSRTVEMSRGASARMNRGPYGRISPAGVPASRAWLPNIGAHLRARLTIGEGLRATATDFSPEAVPAVRLDRAASQPGECIEAVAVSSGSVASRVAQRRSAPMAQVAPGTVDASPPGARMSYDFKEARHTVLDVVTM